MTLSIKKFNISDIIKRIKSEKLFKTDGEVANLLGLQRSTLAERKRQNSIPYDELVNFSDKENYSLNWILYGEEPKRREEKAIPGMIHEPPAAYSEETLYVLITRVQKIYKEGDLSERAAIRGMIDEVHEKLIERIEARLKAAAAETKPELKKANNAG